MEDTNDPVATPTTPTKATPHPSMGLGSPELLKELKQPHTLKHISTHSGLTTVFSGRGRPNQTGEGQSKTPASHRPL